MVHVEYCYRSCFGNFSCMLKMIKIIMGLHLIVVLLTPRWHPTCILLLTPRHCMYTPNHLIGPCCKPESHSHTSFLHPPLRGIDLLFSCIIVLYPAKLMRAITYPIIAIVISILAFLCIGDNISDVSHRGCHVLRLY